MNDDWRYNPERLDDRRFCLAALLFNGCAIDKGVYEFCHHFTSSGECQGMLAKYEGDKASPEAFTAVYEAYLTYNQEVLGG